MSFVLPTFNLVCKVWSLGSPPPNPPRIASLACNLAFGKRVQNPGPTVFNAITPLLLVPAGSDLRWIINGIGNGDIVECPAGTGRYYSVACVEDIGKGFPNEHRAGFLEATRAYGDWPIPTP
jgi:hypothetical protein